MAVKKYWIRYNKGADRLEQQITIGILRPNGPGWIEVDVDHCCNTIEQTTSAQSVIDLGGVGCTCNYTLSIDGQIIDNGCTTTETSTLQDILECLQTAYDGFLDAEFEIVLPDSIKVTLKVTNAEVALNSECTCE